jgi:dynein heavy chain
LSNIADDDLDASRCCCLQSVVALITTDVHNRDVVMSLLASGVSSVSDFGWQMQLRFDYDTDTDSIMACQVNAR